MIWFAAAVATACGERLPPVAVPVVPLRTEPIPLHDQSSQRFGALFCGVLSHVKAAGEAWDECGRYFRPVGSPRSLNDDIDEIDQYRVLAVPGIFGQCLDDVARPFQDAARHLRAAHGIDVEHMNVSAFGSSSFNAAQIAAYLETRFSGPDRRPYIAFGYSKGASDLLEAVVAHEIARTGIAAIVTIAGSVLGSRLTDAVPRRLLDFLRRSRVATCDVGDGAGIESLRRSERAASMARFVAADGFRAYSVAAVSDATTTSDVLRDGWNRLRVHSLEQDGQIIHDDAIVPRGIYLGIAKGDHWAVALPFEDLPADDPRARALGAAVNRNHFPRTALFEACLRYVLEDLRTTPAPQQPHAFDPPPLTAP